MKTKGRKGAGTKSTSQLVRPPVTQAGKRHLEKRAAKVVENDKTTIFIRGSKTSQLAQDCMMDIMHLKKPNVVKLIRKNSFLPFDDDTPLEKFCQKYDASLFCFVNHTKKRPNNLILGRMYDFHVLDMFEFQIESFASILSFKEISVKLGTKPCLLFYGSEFRTDDYYVRLKCFLIDFFRGPKVNQLSLLGVEYALTFTIAEGKLLLRAFNLCLKPTGGGVPRVELLSAGPSVDLSFRRHKLASTTLYNTACKVPDSVKQKKVKNVEKDVFGTTRGRLHLKQASLGEIKRRKIKALKLASTQKRLHSVASEE